MADIKHPKSRTSPPLAERIMGKVKRAAGELTGRPDLVIEGEAQDTGLPPEDQVPTSGAKVRSDLRPKDH
jgi:hypothetical protein